MCIPNFLPREALYLSCAVFDQDQSAYGTVDKLTQLIMDSVRDDRYLKHVRVTHHVNIRDLCAKIAGAADEFPQALARIMRELKSGSSPYSFAYNGLPSRAVLGRLGLIAPHQPVAHSICFARAANWHCDEIVLYNPERIAHYRSLDMTIDDVVASMAALTDAMSDRSESPRLGGLQIETAYHIAALTGLRYFRVECGIDDSPDVLHPIPWDVLAREIDNKHLGGLTIAGVNAPDNDFTSALYA